MKVMRNIYIRCAPIPIETDNPSNLLLFDIFKRKLSSNKQSKHFLRLFFFFSKKKSITISKWHLFLIWNDALNNGATQLQKIKKPNRSALLIRRFSRRFVTINLTACFTFDAQNLHQITWHWIKHKSVRVSNQVKCRANWPDILK